MPKKILSGVIIRAKCNKTLKVLVLRICKDKLYKKIVKRYKKYTVHDENNICRLGDRVFIQEHRPISNTKKWVIVQVK
ncbi:30S ribosomal protein S17 [Wolbachia endosymbiont of Cruorifilaria tuberocauda]|uniref:30S ribosomal protein S17 n=1 Tax=Wolbachia endosymbiont of Cruorifilaria tuberocauda TaxID=1812111 RepID=UPI001589E05E|nr:30S ribosomal protein S17 [Wolbachia endosymbiont of Cruorifilaria tuberocauda]QKX01595.1 30S ribosomal protein S17 [Wolbachia endosymbiont of Cruorifilaria tuberocauda]